MFRGRLSRLLQTSFARATSTPLASHIGGAGMQAAAGAAAAPRALLVPPPTAALAAAASALLLRGRRPLSSLLAAATKAAAAAEQPPPSPPKRRATRAATTKASSEDGDAPPKPRARRTTKKTSDEGGEETTAPAPAPAAAAAKKKRATKTASPSPSSSAFYGPSDDEGDDKATFTSLGLHPLVCEGLEKGPFALRRPSRVQRLSAPALLAGGDVVLAAETGSGKTLAYLAPLVTSLLRRREARRAEKEQEAGSEDKAAAAASPPPPPQQQRRRAGRAEEGDLLLVLCPNAALCEQVVRAAHAIAPSSNPLVRAAFVSSAKPPPFEAPDVAVATPSGLAALLRAAAAAPGGPPYGALWTAAGLGRAVGAVVVDEADLMLSGGYSRDLAFLLDALKVSERRAAEARAARLLGLPGGARELGERLPLGGTRARDVKLALWASRGDLVEWTREMDRLNREREEEEGREQKGRKTKTRAAPGDAAAGASSRTPRSPEAEFAAAVSRLRRLLRLRDGDVDHRLAATGPPQEPAPRGRQHVFVAATLPSLTKADAGTELERRYRGAAWVRGDLLHRALPGVGHSWVPMAPAADGEGDGGADARGRKGASDEELDDARYARAWEAALSRAVVEDDEDWRQGRARVLVFARDARRAEAAAAIVSRAASAAAAASNSSSPPFEVHSYHKGAPAEAREAALEAMRRPVESDNAADGKSAKSGSGTGKSGKSGSGSVAVACTDAAARGLDLPLVTHVVQADFAGNASDFLHRVGRTARAGREGGKVTSIYRAGAEEGESGGNEAVLAGALKAAVERGEPIEGAFSRNRSFARKVKRYGGYVARGEAGSRPRD